MNKDELLEEISVLLEKHVQSMACSEKICEMIDDHEISVCTSDFLLGKTENPFELSLYASFIDKIKNDTSTDYKKDILEMIEDDPETYRKRGLFLSNEFEKFAKEIRALLLTGQYEHR